MALQTKYITLDEFTQYFPEIPLVRSLGSEEKALAFLKRIEDRLSSFINGAFNRNIEIEYPVFSEFQKEHYKLALLEQVLYVFKNGDISADSGYDPDTLAMIDRKKLKGITISPNTIDHLRECGIWNRNLRSSRMGSLWWIR